MQKTFPSTISRFFRSNLFLILFLVVFIILRIPSLFEPHWYGDEGIYASVANALEHGKKMYVDVYDNRLPFIYYLYSLATTDNRLITVKLFSIIAGVITLIGIDAISKKLHFKYAGIVVLLVGTWFLGSPRFEGNIANTENFFLPFTVWGVWFALSEKKRSLFFAGLLFGMAFLVKFLPFFSFIAVTLYILITSKKFSILSVQKLVSFGLGFFVPLVIVGSLLFLNGNLKQAVEYGLLNNTSYVAQFNTGNTTFIKVAMLLLSIGVGSFLYLSKKISNTALFITLLFSFDFYAVLFSGRKYEHYLIQIVPSLALLTGYIGLRLMSTGKIVHKVTLVFCFIILIFGGKYIFYKGSGTAIEMNIPNYYREFVVSTLRMHFEPSLPFTFYREPGILKIAQYIVNKYKTKDIFFYSNESWIYDYAHIIPPTLFVAAYHETLVPNGARRTVMDLKKSKPKVIAIDKKREVSLPLSEYLKTDYQKDFEDTYFEYYIPLTSR